MTITWEDASEAATGDSTSTHPLHEQDVQTYIETIMPLLDPADDVFMIDTDAEEEAAQHSEPIPGHWHYLDRGYW